MSDRFESLHEITDYHTEKVVEALKRGEPLRHIVAEIIVNAAHWGGENVRIYEAERAKADKA